MNPILSRLKEILTWWKKQTFFNIYASSVLLAYDSAVVRENFYYKSKKVNTALPSHLNNVINLTRDTKSGIESWLRVYLIDFAHVVPSAKNSLDFNYIDGLTSLINVFENLLIEFRVSSIENVANLN